MLELTLDFVLRNGLLGACPADLQPANLIIKEGLLHVKFESANLVFADELVTALEAGQEWQMMQDARGAVSDVMITK